MTDGPELSEALQDAIMHELQQTGIPAILGGSQKIFFGTAIRDTPFPYLCYGLDIDSEITGDVHFWEAGEIVFDVWDFATTNKRVLRVQRILRDLFHRAHMEVPGAAGCRMWYTGGRQAPIENNRSNRRSEDERFWRREVSFYVRVWDQRAAEAHLAGASDFGSNFFDLNDERYYQVQARAVRLNPSLYRIPESALRILQYRIGSGPLLQDFTRVATDKLLLPTLETLPVTVTYIPS